MPYWQLNWGASKMHCRRIFSTKRRLLFDVICSRNQRYALQLLRMCYDIRDLVKTLLNFGEGMMVSKFFCGDWGGKSSSMVPCVFGLQPVALSSGENRVLNGKTQGVWRLAGGDRVSVRKMKVSCAFLGSTYEDEWRVMMTMFESADYFGECSSQERGGCDSGTRMPYSCEVFWVVSRRINDVHWELGVLVPEECAAPYVRFWAGHWTCKS